MAILSMVPELKHPDRSLTLIALSSLLFLSSLGGSQHSSQVSIKGSMCVPLCAYLSMRLYLSVWTVCACVSMCMCVHE